MALTEVVVRETLDRFFDSTAMGNRSFYAEILLDYQVCVAYTNLAPMACLLIDMDTNLITNF